MYPTKEKFAKNQVVKTRKRQNLQETVLFQVKTSQNLEIRMGTRPKKHPCRPTKQCYRKTKRKKMNFESENMKKSSPLTIMYYTAQKTIQKINQLYLSFPLFSVVVVILLFLGSGAVVFLDDVIQKIQKSGLYDSESYKKYEG